MWIQPPEVILSFSSGGSSDPKLVVVLTWKLESHIIEMHTYPLHRTATRGLYKQTNTAFQTYRK